MGVAFNRSGRYNTQHKCCTSNNGLSTWFRRESTHGSQNPSARRHGEHRSDRKTGRAPRPTNADEFGTWFRVKLEGAFTEGKSVRGRLSIPGYEHVTLEMLVERIDPERYFSYRWHPYAVDPAVDYSAEPTTLVEFTLEDTEGGTALTIVESGFDRLPPARRAEAFRMNDSGWTGQIKQLAKYVE